MFENIGGESQTKVQQNDRNWRLNVFVYWQFDKMFLSCLRRALSQSPRLASMRSAYVMSGRLALHARSVSFVTRWNRSPSVTHTPKYEITGTQWQRYLHTPGNCRVSVFFWLKLLLTLNYWANRHQEAMAALLRTSRTRTGTGNNKLLECDLR